MNANREGINSTKRSPRGREALKESIALWENLYEPYYLFNQLGKKKIPTQ